MHTARYKKPDLISHIQLFLRENSPA